MAMRGRAVVNARGERRAGIDQECIERFAQRVRQLFPNCPAGTEHIVAEHACLKYSGRLGRSAAAKTLDQNAVKVAVIAHVRHVETSYDKLLAEGCDRHESRRRVADRVRSILQAWS